VQTLRRSPGPAVVFSAVSVVLVAMVSTVPGSPLVPRLPAGVVPGGPFRWLAGVIGLDALHGGWLVAEGVVVTLVAAVSFLCVLRRAWRGDLSLRAVVLMAVAYDVIVMLVPVVFSRDVYSYISYGQIASLHHANPYVQVPADFPRDAIYPLVGHKWVGTPAVYGPLFTGLSAVLTRWVHSIPALVTAFRLVAAAASLGTIALVARTAGRHRPSRAAFAVAAFGMNPVIVFQSVGGGHNDMLLALGIAGAFALVLARRHLLAVAVLALVALIKASAALPLFLLLVWIVARRPAGQRLRAAFTHGGVAAAIGLVVAAPFFQPHDPTLGMFELAGHEGWLAPSRLVHRFLDWISFDTLGVLGRVGFAALLVWFVVQLARAVARRASTDAQPFELGAAWGWSLLLLMLLGPVLLPWYVAWSLPMVWLLPRVPRAVLIGTGVALTVSQWTTEPLRYPRAYEINVLLGHYLLTPLVLAAAVWLCLDLRRRLRSGDGLAEDAPREVAAAAGGE
jgi:alpha-1,6-mannosyltransferase